MKYYSPIDRFFNRFRKKGFLLYAGIVIVATAYSFYSISNLPDVNKLKELEEKKREQQLKKQQHQQQQKDGKKNYDVQKEGKKEQDKQEDGKKNHDDEKKRSALFVEEELLKDKNEVDNWSRKELHAYLSRHKIYPDLDTSIQELKEQVKVIYYEDKVAHFI